MTNILDNFSKQQTIDKSNLYGSVVELPLQCTHAFKETSKIKVPDSYRNINNIIMVGMGGSGLGARVIESVFSDELKHPLTRLHDYTLPSFANEKTLFICSSYSGTTEEPLNMLQQALAKKCKVLGIAAGGTLRDLAKKHNFPLYLINPVHNPSQQPRMAIGYSIIGQLVLASKAGLFSLAENQINKFAKRMNQIIDKNKVEISEAKSQAKKFAKKFFKKQVVFVSASHLTGSVHTVKNQMNENAKHFSARHDIPELNHHLMEGLTYPDSNKKDLIYFFVDSDLYLEKVQKRFAITKDVVKKNKIEYVSYKPISKSRLSQAFEFVQFGGFVNYYLTMLHGIDPSPIPWVDYFKNKLGQPLGDFK